MKNIKIILYLFTLSSLFYSCDNFEQNIDIELPEPPPQLFVECYLEEGKIMRLALTETQAILSEPTLPIINNATVSITHNGTEYFLENEIFADTTENKAYNYISEEVLNEINGEYELNILDAQGRQLSGKTRFLEKPQIENIEARFRESDSMAFVLVTFPDPNPEEDNFFRVSINRDSLTGSNELNFAFQDLFTTDNKITVGTGYDYEKDDTLFISVYHIEKQYHDFIESVEDAANANGNPFAQPAVVRHTVKGGAGVFTTLVYDRRLFVVKEE